MFVHRFIKPSFSPILRDVTHQILRSTSTNSVASRDTWRPFQQEINHPDSANREAHVQQDRTKSSNSQFLSRQQNDRHVKMDRKRSPEGVHASKRRKIEKPTPFLPEGSNDEILAIEVADLLSKVSLNGQNGHSEQSEAVSGNSQTQTKDLKKGKPVIDLQSELELDVIALSSTGDGLAYNDAKDHIIVVPFAMPGDRVLAKIYRWAGQHSQADFIKVIAPSPQREGVTPKCQYFTQCSGCQFQMIPYDTQLEHKRTIVKKAFERFSGMKPEQVPEVEPTMGSPLQYGYRTKLTPHFTRPFSRRPKPWDHIPKIGYNIKGRRDVMDIESCPIGTDIVQEGLRVEREVVKETIQNFKNGATILLRESTERTYNTTPSTVNGDASSTESAPPPTIPSNPLDLVLQSTDSVSSQKSGNSTITYKYPTHTDIKTYTSDSKALATEYVTVTTDPTSTPPQTRTYKFTNTAGSFFQNNNAILGVFTSYIYSHCLPETTTAGKPIKYLLDAYSGSGLFSLTLSPLFTSTLGIDIDARSIAAARENAKTNKLSNTGFIDADAAALFADVPYPPDQTLVVIDPPRKGCDRAFLRQLRKFGPKRVVYVSCNVHSQARDVGVLVNGFVKGSMTRAGWVGGEERDEEWEVEGEEGGLARYTIERVRGFDFFPQTGHVEGVCILDRVG